MDRILVTGGSGYVGSVLTHQLADQRIATRVYETMEFGNPVAYLSTRGVEFVKGDIRDTDRLRQALDGIDAVVHLAGIVTDDLVDMNPALAQQVNRDATEALCRLAIEAKVKRLIYASSSSVYGSSGHDSTESDEPHPETEYARTKLAGEEIALQYAEQMHVWCIRSATACGPSPRMRLDTIINTFCAQAWFKRQITVFDGSQWRSNVHVADVATLYARLATIDERHALQGGVYNFTYANHTALELARFVHQECPTSSEIIVDSSREDKRHYRMRSNANLRAIVRTRSFTTAVRDNFRFFAAGGITDPNDSIYFNTRRMAGVMQEGQWSRAESMPGLSTTQL